MARATAARMRLPCRLRCVPACGGRDRFEFKPTQSVANKAVVICSKLTRTSRQQPERRLMDGRVAGRDDAAVGRSEEHTSELQSLMRITYAVFCLKKQTA